VQLENEQFLMARYLLSSEHGRFVWQLANVGLSERTFHTVGQRRPVRDLLNLALTYLSHLLARARDKNTLSFWDLLLRRLLSSPELQASARLDLCQRYLSRLLLLDENSVAETGDNSHSSEYRKGPAGQRLVSPFSLLATLTDCPHDRVRRLLKELAALALGGLRPIDRRRLEQPQTAFVYLRRALSEQFLYRVQMQARFSAEVSEFRRMDLASMRKVEKKKRHPTRFN
jgi:hypothetical protein